MKQVLNETNIEQSRDVTANCMFFFCHMINSLLTELVRSQQEDTAGLVLSSLVCGPRLRLGPKKRKKNSTVQYPPVRTSRSVNNIYIMISNTVFDQHENVLAEARFELTPLGFCPPLHPLSYSAHGNWWK